MALCLAIYTLQTGRAAASGDKITLSWSLFYSLREGLDGFRRAKLASFIAIMTMSFSLVIIGILVIVIVNLTGMVEDLRRRIEFEVFIDNGLGKAGIAELERQINQVPGVAEAKFISKEEAAEIFRRAFAAEAQNGKTILDVLDFNPLPNSFRLSLQKPYQNSDAAQRLAGEIKKLHGVDDVMFRREWVLALDQYVNTALSAGAMVGVVFCFGALLLVINDVRLVIHAKRRLIETMQLVGATRAFVQRPLLIQGALQGALGGLIAAGILYTIYQFSALQFGTALRLPDFLFTGLIMGGIVLGLGASYLGARKYIQ
jgi:cell division transport system permease protein